MQSRLLLALAIGGTLEVAKGADVGGSFKHVPICHQPGQTGCVVGYRSYLAGTTPKPFATDIPPPGFETVCVNPNDLDGAPHALGSFFPIFDDTRRHLRGIDGVKTPWIGVPDLYRAECVNGQDGFRYLAVSVATPAADTHAGPIDLTNRWLRGQMGLHILDLQLPQGDLVELVARRAAALP